MSKKTILPGINQLLLPLVWSIIQQFKIKILIFRCEASLLVGVSVVGNNKVSGQLENFFRWNPSGTFRNIPWHHWNNPKKVPGAPSQGFLKFLVFVKNVTKFKNWLSRPHFLANFQLSYHFGKLLTVRSQGFTASKNLGLHQ